MHNLRGQQTSSSLMTFTLAMVENPHVWKRAQAEIDAVIGTNRFPEFDDRSALPYVDAIVRETLRWKPVGPLGVWSEANLLSERFLNTLKVSHTRSREAIFTKAIIYLKVCSNNMHVA